MCLPAFLIRGSVLGGLTGTGLRPAPDVSANKFIRSDPRNSDEVLPIVSKHNLCVNMPALLRGSRLSGRCRCCLARYPADAGPGGNRNFQVVQVAPWRLEAAGAASLLAQAPWKPSEVLHEPAGPLAGGGIHHPAGAHSRAIALTGSAALS